MKNDFSFKLEELSIEDRRLLSLKFLTEQFFEQRQKNEKWQILTGHRHIRSNLVSEVAQQLVSIVSGVRGFSGRSRGFDLIDGSIVKVADSLDDKRSRWNFMHGFSSINRKDKAFQQAKLTYMNNLPYIYLVLFDYSPFENIRIRIWRLDPKEHKKLLNRYVEWAEATTDKIASRGKESANFQIAPPRSFTEENVARHGGERSIFSPIEIELEMEDGCISKKIFHAEENRDKHIVEVYTFDPK